MRAIILAAGRGSRMGDLTSQQPKCRTAFRGKSLIEWQLGALREAGIEEIAIVRGYLAHTFDFDVRYFDNPRWQHTNMVMSLMQASSWLQEGPCIVSYSDIVYSADAVERLMAHSGEIVISYDPNWRKLWELRFDDPLSDAETFKLKGGRVVEIGQKPKGYEEIEGQYMGLLKFTPYGWAQVVDFLNSISPELSDRMDMTSLLQGLIAREVNLDAVGIADDWYEVDSESDLRRYELMSAPI